MITVPRPPLESPVVRWQKRQPWETPEAHAARVACAEDLWRAIRDAERDTDGKVAG